MDTAHNARPKATDMDTVAKEHVFNLVNTNSTNIDSADKAALRVVNKEFMRFVPETATKLSYNGSFRQKTGDPNPMECMPKCLEKNILQISINRLPVKDIIQGIHKFANIHTLCLEKCAELEDLTGLHKLSPNLLTLKITGCKKLANLEDIATCNKLQTLRLGDCNVTDISPLAMCTLLEDLDLSDCSDITDLSPLVKCTRLRKLTLRCCESITDLSPLEECTQLEDLDMEDCSDIEDISPLSNCTGLKKLSLRHCEILRDIWPLEECTLLETLDLGMCGGFVDISPLSNLTRLKELHLSGDRTFTDISPLANLTRLEVLNLGYCESIRDISPLTNLKMLKELYLRDCFNIMGISMAKVLIKCTRLEKLYLGRLRDTWKGFNPAVSLYI